MKNLQTGGSMYVVTPPDIKLNDKGPSFLILGESSDNFQSYMDTHDRMLPTNDILFYGSTNGITEENMGWFKAVSNLVDTIFLDLSKITMVELFLALQYTDSGKAIFGLANGTEKTILSRLISNFESIMLFDDLEHFQTSIMTELTQ